MTVGEPFSVSANQELGILPVDVRVVDDVTDTRSEAPEFGGTSTFTLPVAGTAQPVQLLQRRRLRYKARVYIVSFNGITGNTLINEGNTASGPAAGTTITSLGPLAPGTYTINVSNLLTGTPTFADAFNTQLLLGATVIGTMGSQGSAEFVNENPPITVIIPAGSSGAAATLFLKTIGAGGGTASYYGQIMATPLTGSGGASQAILHYRIEPLMNANPQTGIQIPLAPYTLEFQSQEPLYGVGLGGTVTVAVIDESYRPDTEL